jgi:hypothetical protein
MDLDCLCSSQLLSESEDILREVIELAGEKRDVAHLALTSKAVRQHVMPNGVLPVPHLTLDLLSEDYIREDHRQRELLDDPEGEHTWLMVPSGRRLPHYRVLFFRLEGKLDLHLLRSIKLWHHGQPDSHRFRFAEALCAILRAMLVSGKRVEYVNMKSHVNISDASLIVDSLAHKGKLRLWDDGVTYDAFRISIATERYATRNSFSESDTERSRPRWSAL